MKAPSNWFQCTAGESGDGRSKATHQAGCAVYNLLQAQSRERKQGLRQTDQEGFFYPSCSSSVAPVGQCFPSPTILQAEALCLKIYINISQYSLQAEV